jgi:hypothetical protein
MVIAPLESFPRIPSGGQTDKEIIMSRRHGLWTILAVVVLALTAGPTLGQVQYRQYDEMRTPQVSPYLSLTNRQTGSTPNYYLYVKPQLDALHNAQRNQAQIQQLERDMNTAAGQTGPVQFKTGHITTFGNYSHFYPGLRSASVATPRAR